MTAFPGNYNTFVPRFDATGKLIVSFSRNPKDFKVNQIVTLTPVQASLGYYLRITAENAARLIQSDLSQFVWPDGADRPTGNWNTESFRFIPFKTVRHDYPVLLGDKAIAEADWDILAAHSAMAAQQAMSARTLLVAQVLSNPANYDPGHSQTATAWGGGFFSAGTSTNPIIKRAFNAIERQILKSTLGVVQRKNLVFVCGPTVAHAMSESAEVHDYVKSSPFALAQLRGDVQSQNAVYGLPDVLYGIRIVVDDSQRVTSAKGATKTVTEIFGTNEAYVISRPGELVGEATGGPSFSSVHIFMKEEMTVETLADPNNRRTQCHVVEDLFVDLVAPASAARITNVLS